MSFGFLTEEGTRRHFANLCGAKEMSKELSGSNCARIRRHHLVRHHRNTGREDDRLLCLLGPLTQRDTIARDWESGLTQGLTPVGVTGDPGRAGRPRRRLLLIGSSLMIRSHALKAAAIAAAALAIAAMAVIMRPSHEDDEAPPGRGWSRGRGPAPDCRSRCRPAWSVWRSCSG